MNLTMRSAIVGSILVAALATAVYVLSRTEPAETSASIALSEAMGGDTTGFALVTEARELVFPADYGPHPEYRTEWWYYTGNLQTADLRHFGFEFTIFRFAVAPPDNIAEASESNWATNQLFMGHLSLSDVQEGDFYAFERFSRPVAGLAGAESDPYRVWLEDWNIEGTPDGAFPTRIQASDGVVSIDLEMEPTKPIVLQGDRGFDPKGPGVGNASYYYSFTRLATEGVVRIQGDSYPVTGYSWKDHEWSTSALGPDQVGWDWFALQLSDEREIMFYQLRRNDGTVSPYTTGVLVDKDGSTSAFGESDVELTVLDYWTSEVSDATYPSGWELQIPRHDIELLVEPLMPNQELNVSVRYWEGAVKIDGTADGQAVNGFGFVEMTGYDPISAGDDAQARSRGAR